MALEADDVEWVVNGLGELGVKIGTQFFFCYKGHSLVYEEPKHEDVGDGFASGDPILWRPVGKREFGECIHPINHADYTMKGTVSYDDGNDWTPLPENWEHPDPTNFSVTIHNTPRPLTRANAELADSAHEWLTEQVDSFFSQYCKLMNVHGGYGVKSFELGHSKIMIRQDTSRMGCADYEDHSMPIEWFYDTENREALILAHKQEIEAAAINKQRDDKARKVAQLRAELERLQKDQ